MTSNRGREAAKREFLLALSEQFHKCTVSIVLDGRFYGTGTLVEINGLKGILTAEHVVHNPEGKRFNNSPDSTQFLDIPVTLFREEFPKNLPERETVRFPVRGLCWYPQYAKDKSFGDWGPDLAFIRLDESLPQVASLKAKKSFWNLNKDVANRTNINKGQRDFFAFVGAPGEWMKDRQKASGKGLVKLLNTAAFFCVDYVYHPNVGDYDFIDIRCGPDPKCKIPDKFAGVSGGGIWFVKIEEDAVPPSPPVHDFWLVGVAFLQDEKIGQPTTIRGHGPNSIYKKFLDELKQNFSSR
jgi:hypothetical protein